MTSMTTQIFSEEVLTLLRMFKLQEIKSSDPEKVRFHGQIQILISIHDGRMRMSDQYIEFYDEYFDELEFVVLHAVALALNNVDALPFEMKVKMEDDPFACAAKQCKLLLRKTLTNIEDNGLGKPPKGFFMNVNMEVMPNRKPNSNKLMFDFFQITSDNPGQATLIQEINSKHELSLIFAW